MTVYVFAICRHSQCDATLCIDCGIAIRFDYHSVIASISKPTASDRRLVKGSIITIIRHINLWIRWILKNEWQKKLSSIWYVLHIHTAKRSEVIPSKNWVGWVGAGHIIGFSSVLMLHSANKYTNTHLQVYTDSRTIQCRCSSSLQISFFFSVLDRKRCCCLMYRKCYFT